MNKLHGKFNKAIVEENKCNGSHNASLCQPVNNKNNTYNNEYYYKQLQQQPLLQLLL